MQNIPDLVVIAGPNGCGKTSIFDAIRLFKVIVGPYNGRELNDIQNRELKNELKNVVTFGCDFAEISLTLQLSESEKIYLRDQIRDIESILGDRNTIGATVKITKTGQVQNLSGSQVLPQLLRHYDPTDQIGTFEYIPSDREAQRGDVGSINLTPINLEDEKLERISNAKLKFNKLKYYLIMMYIFDKMEVSEENEKFLPEIQRFFDEFFFPKKFKGVHTDKTLRWQFPIETPDGIHDIDFLSSGEIEILMTYANILKMKHTDSVILFDEPELHLNAALERKIINRIKKIVDSGNQVWLSTHSLEIIGSVPLANLYKMNITLPTDSHNQIELCSSKNDRFETLKTLGASTGIQLISQKIVFVEGFTDKEILDLFFEEFGDVVTFVKTKGVNPLMGVGQALTDILNQVTQYDSCFLIRDRDFLEEAYVEKIKKTYAGKVFVWSTRDIENFLIEPTSILKVLKLLNINGFSGKESVDDALKQIADQLKVNVIADMLAYSINGKLNEKKFGLPHTNSLDALEKSLLEIGVVQRDKFVQQFSVEELTKLLDEKKKLVEDTWETNWRNLCDGKEVLLEFINKHVTPTGSGINLVSFRNLIISEMKNSKSIPTEIIDIVQKKILGDILQT